MQELAAAQAGSLYPQVGLTAGIGGQKYGAEFLGTQPKPPPFKYFAIGPAVSYALDYTGGIARSVEQQYALADFQRQQLNAAYLAVSGNAVMQALRIASLRSQIATIEAILAQDRENLELVQLAFDAGSVSPPRHPKCRQPVRQRRDAVAAAAPGAQRRPARSRCSGRRAPRERKLARARS